MSNRTPWRRLIIIAATFSVAAIVFLVISHIAKQWRFSVLETSTLRAGAECRRVRFNHAQGSFEAFCIVLDRANLEASVVDLGAYEAKPLRSVCDEQHAIVVINGGYFDARREPIGLLRVGGQTISPFVDRAPLSGCLLINSTGDLAIAPAADTSIKDARDAIQAGPFLIDPGGGVGIHKDSASAAERTVIAMAGTKACLICTTPVTLLNLSQCLADSPDAFGLREIDCALNLDGGPSTGMILRAGNRDLVREPRGKIRDALVIRPK